MTEIRHQCADVSRAWPVRAAAVCLFALALLATALAPAQTFPVRPIRLICPQAAGGPADIFSRLVADQLSQTIGQPVVVENKTGAATMIGAEQVARAPADGYTLLMASVTTLAINPSLFPKIAYDPQKDFAPITVVTSVPMFLMVNIDLPVKSVQELIALAKTRPGKLNYPSPGAGTSPHLTTALFATLVGIDVVHVPYKGAAASMQDLIAGQVHFSLDTGGLQYIRAGKVRGIGVTSRNRSPAAPELPTFIEQGLPGFEVVAWNGVVAPAGTPQPVVHRLHAEIVRGLNAPSVRERLRNFAAEGVGNSPEEFAALIRTETARWAKVIRDGNVKVD